MAEGAVVQCLSLPSILDSDRKKILFLGKSGSGKTSIMESIFFNNNPADTKKIDSINNIYSTKLLFFDYIISLWDCEGNKLKMEIYVSEKNQTVCQNVDILVYVFNVQNQGDEWKEEMNKYQSCLSTIIKNSSAPKVICLLHKIDLIPKDKREKVFLERKKEIKRVSKLADCVYYKTSILDDTLFKAWSLTFRTLIPKIKELDKCVQRFGNSMDTHKVLLFDSFTLLVISCYQQMPIEEDHSAALSAVLRQYQQSRSKERTVKWTSVENKCFTLVIRDFMANSYLVGVFPDPETASPIIGIACKRFEELDEENLVDQFSGNLSLY